MASTEATRPQVKQEGATNLNRVDQHLVAETSIRKCSNSEPVKRYFQNVNRRIRWGFSNLPDAIKSRLTTTSLGKWAQVGKVGFVI